MFETKKTKKVMIVTLAALSLCMSGCMNNRNIKQQNVPAPLNQQQVQPPQNVDNRIEVANKAATKIVKLKSIQQANVLVTNRNAYVATVLRNDQKLTRDIEDQIADQVRATDPNIQNVYVSTNPDMADRFNTYVQDIQEGRPVAGFVEQFNEMVQRIFPNAR